MELGNLPLWAQQLGGLLLTIATAVALTWSERKKRKNEPAPHASGEAQVVAATFVERSLMERLITEVSTLNGHVAELNERMHDEELVRAAAARIRENKP